MANMAWDSLSRRHRTWRKIYVSCSISPLSFYDLFPSLDVRAFAFNLSLVGNCHGPHSIRDRRQFLCYHRRGMIFFWILACITIAAALSAQNPALLASRAIDRTWSFIQMEYLYSLDFHPLPFSVCPSTDQPTVFVGILYRY